MTVTSRSTRRVAVSCFVLLVLGMAGCGAVQSILDLEKPTARIAGVGIADINLESATLTFEVEVSNPYPVPLPLVNVDYGLASGGTRFLAGQAQLQGAVPARGKKTVSVPATIVYTQLLAALKGVRPGSVLPYKADLGFSVDSKIAGPLRLPLHMEGELPIPTVPQVEVTQINWDRMTLSNAGGRVNLRIVNSNEFPVTLSKLDYALSLGNVEVARSSLAKAVAFDASGGAGAVEIPISFAPAKLGLAVFGMLTGKGAGYSLKGTLAVDTPFGPMTLPVEKTGDTVFRR